MSIVKREDRVIAAFDIGSNSIKMTVARPGPDGTIDEFAWDAETVRLGAGIESSGRLADDRIDAAMAAIARFARDARAAGATRLLGVATEAVRTAANGADFLERVRREAGVEISAISGDREAELTFLGLAVSVDLAGRILVADIGGASTELIAADEGRVAWARSIPLGSGRLTDSLLAHDPPTAEELGTCQNAATAQLDAIPLPKGSDLRLVVVGGTGEYMLRLLPPDRSTTPEDVDHVLKRLTTVSAARLSALIEAPEARARVLPAGIAIVRAIASLTLPEAIEGARSGIRTGLLQAAFRGEV